MELYYPSPLPSVETIKERLEKIFFEGISDRNFLIREAAAKSIFTFLYIGAIEGNAIWLAPKHIYRMGNVQADKQSEEERENYCTDCRRPGYKSISESWYSDNSREQVRDETINGLVQKGAILVNQTIPTTSSKGRYSLKRSFADLFILDDIEFEDTVEQWQKHNLNSAELARIQIMQRRQASSSSVTVNFPSGESRVMKVGESSNITKAVVEEFAVRHLKSPAVVWISESGNKVVAQDDELMQSIGLSIDQSTLLPDVILADLGRDRMLFIFVEVVYSDGPITEDRKRQILEKLVAAGYTEDNALFVSAFEHRNSSALKRRFSGIAVDSLVWCMAEPELLIWLGQNKMVPFSLDIEKL
jgi:hypothetical protein